MAEYGFGLRIYPNNGSLGSQFVSVENTETPFGNLQLEDVAGTPWSDTIVFTLRKQLWFNVQQFWGDKFTVGVTQRRLASGKVLLIPQKYPCDMCRVCWDVMDKRIGERFVETATGLVVLSQVEVEYWQEQWQITLYQGDYYVNQLGELEASTKGCGSSSSGSSGGGNGSGNGGGVQT